MRTKIRNTYVYSIWNNYNDDIIIIDGTAKKCAEALGLKNVKCFYDTYSLCKKGKIKKYTIVRKPLKDIEFFGVIK